ncbi:MAG: hypothetical protein HKN46_05750 [Acidimicrobiia bacterium]|nr:hypothetical protein [Acidimicrobiia bacterium]
MSPDDTIIFAVGVFITFMTVWGAVLIGVSSVQQKRYELSIEENEVRELGPEPTPSA